MGSRASRASGWAFCLVVAFAGGLWLLARAPDAGSSTELAGIGLIGLLYDAHRAATGTTTSIVTRNHFHASAEPISSMGIELRTTYVMP